MKKRLMTLFLILSFCSAAYADDVRVYSQDNKFGLKNSKTQITEAQYTKLIRLGTKGWIIQKHDKYGIMDSTGKILVEPKYRNADRVTLNSVKLGNDNDYGIYSEDGTAIIAPIYQMIVRISKDYYLTYKNYKYGLITLKGDVILRNMFDSILIPDSKTLVIQYQGEWYELNVLDEKDLKFKVTELKKDDKDNSIGEVLVKTGAASGYSVVTFTDYVLKLFSSVSPAYEATIDELMFSKGADTVQILMNFSWLPKLPFTYLKNYYKNIRNTDTGVLKPARNYLKKKM